MKKYTFQGLFRIDALLDELHRAGIATVTISGNIERKKDPSSADTTIQVYVRDDVQGNALESQVAAHTAKRVDAQREAERMRIAVNRNSAVAKLSAFYLNTVGLSEDELNDTNLLEMK